MRSDQRKEAALVCLAWSPCQGVFLRNTIILTLPRCVCANMFERMGGVLASNSTASSAAEVLVVCAFNVLFDSSNDI